MEIGEILAVYKKILVTIRTVKLWNRLHKGAVVFQTQLDKSLCNLL